MKIRSRKQRLKEYNESHPVREPVDEELIKAFFKRKGWSLDKAVAKARKKAKKILKTREYETVHITLYEYPMETARARVVNGRAYSPNAAENKKYFESAMCNVAEALRLVSTPAEIRIDAYMEMPSGVSQDELLLFEAGILDPVVRPDFDNLAKAYSDMMTGILTIDDDIFHKAVIKKRFSVIPRVEIWVTYLKTNESNYVYKKLRNRKCVKEATAAGKVELSVL